MLGFMKSPIKVFKQSSVDTGFPAGSSSTNPFDSDTDSDSRQTLKPSRRTSSEPLLITPKMNSNHFDDDNERRGLGINGRFENQTVKPSRRTSSEPLLITPKMNSNHFDDDNERRGLGINGRFENQTVQDLENYAMYKAEETTKSVFSCLKIAENIREDATKTLDMLHHQGEQIERTHRMAADMDKDLSKGEKLLNNLGGMFSKPWKPEKTREILGPVITADNNSYGRSENHKEQREKLGVVLPPKGGRSSSGTPPTGALQRVEVEKEKQDDAVSDLSNILGDLKNMAVDMGSEIDRQNKALDHLSDDVDELNFRVKGANHQTRRLLGK